MLLRSSGQPSSQDRHSYRIGITEVGLDSCVVPVAMRLLAFSLIGLHGLNGIGIGLATEGTGCLGVFSTSPRWIVGVDKGAFWLMRG